MMFSAHGKVHPRTGDYINFGAGIAGFGLKGPKTCLNIFRINSDGRLYRKGRIALDAFPFCHDFALTDKYAVFFLGFMGRGLCRRHAKAAMPMVTGICSKWCMTASPTAQSYRYCVLSR